MFTVCCLLRGENRVVSVDMEATELVTILKELVIDNLQLECLADKLQLYRVENLVQSAEDCSLRVLLGGREYSDDTVEFQNLVDQAKLMAPAHPVSTYLLNTLTAPGSIHVLVEQPRVKDGEESLDGSGAATTAERSHAKRERECIPFAEMTVEQRKQLTSEIRLSVRVRNIRERIASSSQIPAFIWGSEDNQGEKWLAYLQEHMGKAVGARGFSLEAVANLPELLSIADDRLPFDLRGGADAVVVKNLGSFTRQNLHHLTGLRVVIDVRQNLASEYPEHEAEAITKLVATSLLAPKSFAGLLLTNLVNLWTFLWIDEHRNIQSITLTQPANAIALVTRLLSKRDDELNFHVLFAGNFRRRKLSDMIAENRKRSMSDVDCERILFPCKCARTDGGAA